MNLNEQNKNFMKLLETIEGIRKVKYKDNISQQILINLLNIENDNGDKDFDVASKLIAELFDKYFKSKNLK